MALRLRITQGFALLRDILSTLAVHFLLGMNRYIFSDFEYRSVGNVIFELLHSSRQIKIKNIFVAELLLREN